MPGNGGLLPTAPGNGGLLTSAPGNGGLLAVFPPTGNGGGGLCAALPGKGGLLPVFGGLLPGIGGLLSFGIGGFCPTDDGIGGFDESAVPLGKSGLAEAAGRCGAGGP